MHCIDRFYHFLLSLSLSFPPSFFSLPSLSPQGPCVGNQETLALSRLWDAMGGFLHIFNPLQQKLIRHSSHMELLLELLQLQEEFFILLRGMIEGQLKMLSSFYLVYKLIIIIVIITKKNWHAHAFNFVVDIMFS